MAIKEYITLDPVTRHLEVPESQSVFGVTDDKDAERKYFRFPRVVGDGVDLTECKIFVCYRSSGGTDGTVLCHDVEQDGNFITFSWLISKNVLDGVSEPNIKFTVQAKKADEDGRLVKVYGSRVAVGTYFASDISAPSVREEFPDVIMSILQKIDEIELVKGNDGKSAYEVALENGFEGTEAEWLQSLKGDSGQDSFTANVEIDGDTVTSDKTYGEVLDAYNNGSVLTAVINGSFFAPLTEVSFDGGGMMLKFIWHSVSSGEYYYVQYLSDADGGISGGYGTVDNTDLSNYYTKGEIDALLAAAPSESYEDAEGVAF